jgi:hypothetical protein
MTERDRLIAERDRLLWLLTHTAHALNEGVSEALQMSYDTHITNGKLTSTEGLEFAVRHLRHKAAVGIALLKP